MHNFISILTDINNVTISALAYKLPSPWKRLVRAWKADLERRTALLTKEANKLCVIFSCRCVWEFMKKASMQKIHHVLSVTMPSRLLY